jgi:hypothetical protein
MPAGATEAWRNLQRVRLALACRTALSLHYIRTPGQKCPALSSTGFLGRICKLGMAAIGVDEGTGVPPTNHFMILEQLMERARQRSDPLKR